jgi:hypothetical protein
MNGVNMATWIAHLRVAENLLGKIEGLDEAVFALGNIAPDSGIPDEKWEKFTPPPELTHFADDNSKDLADLDYYRQYLAGLQAGQAGAERFSFLLGYFCHLVTDNLWSHLIGRPTQARFAVEFAANPKFGWTVKDDWYGLDFVYVRDHPNSLFWRTFLKCEVTQSYLDFLPVEALRQRTAYIQEKYQKRDVWVEAAYTRPYVYLSQAEMDAFVESASQRLEAIYRRLWVDGEDAGQLRSALELA